MRRSGSRPRGGRTGRWIPKWGKKFRKSAVEGQWFTGDDGFLYQFGDRGSAKGSRFLLRRIDPGGGAAAAAPVRPLVS